MSNLFSCLWFNEVDRFTPRDQLSFAYTYHKLRRMNPEKPFYLHMFKVSKLENASFELAGLDGSDQSFTLLFMLVVTITHDAQKIDAKCLIINCMIYDRNSENFYLISGIGRH